ncbi:hypothetical protein [Corallococcus sp. AS-1-6]|uniref:hypothetical protein n=1 Tax=Corallococcus TaxID=83461 RepID=UPI001CC1A4D7|nr:hypothetical protein [Corallococcus sp. AS-1-6]MBZ4373791.1 hypothetical protein [Corallococcus sp. AS-1-6]
MAHLLVEPMDTAAAWSALAPDGVTPSTELSIADETTQVRPGTDGHSGRITASATAAGHLLRRTLGAPVDLTPYRELRLWLNASRVATGAPAQPFFLELRLGSVALPADAASNTWNRFLPVAQASTWELHRLSLDDLAPATRSAVVTLQLRCVAEGPFTCCLDDVLAVRDEMVSDVEAALLERLHNVLVVEGSPVPAEVHSPDVAPPAKPYLRVTPLGVEPSDARTPSTTVRSDFSSTGFRTRPAGFAYDLWYQVEAFASSRADEARLLDFALQRLPPRGDLLVNGAPIPLEMRTLPATELIGGSRGERVGLVYRVLARNDSLPATGTRGVSNVLVAVDPKVA